MKKLLIKSLMFLATSLSLFSNETIVLSTGEWAPYTSEKDPKGQVAQKIVTEALKFENIDVSYKFYKWADAYSIAKDVKSDGTIPWFKNKKRENDFLFSKQAIIRTKMLFFHLKDKSFTWKSFDDLKKYKICGVKGYSTTKLLNDKGLSLTLSPNAKNCFTRLLLNEVDVVPSSYLVGYNIINKSFSPKDAARFTTHSKQVQRQTGAFFLVSKQNPHAIELVAKFDKGLKQLIKSGRYLEIIKDSIKK